MININLIESVDKLKLEIDNNYKIAKSLIKNDFVFKVIEFNETEIAKIAKIKNVIYFIEISDFTNFNSKEFLTNFLKFKKNNPKIKLPQINSLKNSNIIYVGKSSTDFKTRIHCHFGDNSLSTYALHFKTWNNRKEFQNIKLRLHYYQFEESIDKHILEIIESSLHFELQPLLGRSGH